LEQVEIKPIFAKGGSELQLYLKRPHCLQTIRKGDAAGVLPGSEAIQKQAFEVLTTYILKTIHANCKF
jgi:hypothetical protein